VTQVPLTGLWVSKEQVLVKEDEILKVFPLTIETDNEFTTADHHTTLHTAQIAIHRHVAILHRNAKETIACWE
jgi:hypothetical protein